MLLSRISLASLRTFAEVARSNSLSLAARQLNISPSAVSHQMKLLEQQLDTSLFIRRARGVKLTAAGERLAERATKAMQQLEFGLTDAVRTSQRQLSIAAIPALMDLWLTPRLHKFYDQYPDIEITLISQDHLVDFKKQSIDLHLHFGSGETMGLKNELIMKEWVVPVSSPSLLERYGSSQELLNSDTVRRLSYLGFDEDRPGGLSWTGWFNQIDGRLNLNQHVSHFSHLSSLFNAAKLGQGIALGWCQLIEADLLSDRLVTLNDEKISLKYSYYAVAPEDHFERDVVSQFLAWLRVECSNENTPF